MNVAPPEAASLIEEPPLTSLGANPARDFLNRIGLLHKLDSVRALNTEMRLEQPGMDEMISAIESAELAYRRFIRLANGPWFNSRTKIESAYEAFNLFGTAGFYKIAVTAGLVSEIGELPGRSRIWPHLETVARTAEAVALQLAPDLADDAFCAGLLHDALIPAMTRELPDYIYYVECGTESDPEVAKQESAAYRFNHAEAAALVAREVFFPEQVVEAVRCHHNETISGISDSRTARILSVLMVAERITSIRRVKADDIFNNPPEQALLAEITAALDVPAAKILRTATENLKRLRLIEEE